MAILQSEEWGDMVLSASQLSYCRWTTRTHFRAPSNLSLWHSECHFNGHLLRISHNLVALNGNGLAFNLMEVNI
jgi:hypothetical protein